MVGVAHRLSSLRGYWVNPEGAPEADLNKHTLTNLYNDRPTWLHNAHARLDRCVFAAYDWREDISDENILKGLLLALNLERSSSSRKSARPPTPTRPFPSPQDLPECYGRNEAGSRLRRPTKKRFLRGPPRKRPGPRRKFRPGNREPFPTVDYPSPEAISLSDTYT